MYFNSVNRNNDNNLVCYVKADAPCKDKTPSDKPEYQMSQQVEHLDMI